MCRRRRRRRRRRLVPSPSNLTAGEAGVGWLAGSRGGSRVPRGRRVPSAGRVSLLAATAGVSAAFDAVAGTETDQKLCRNPGRGDGRLGGAHSTGLAAAEVRRGDSGRRHADHCWEQPPPRQMAGPPRRTATRLRSCLGSSIESRRGQCGGRGPEPSVSLSQPHVLENKHSRHSRSSQLGCTFDNC